MGGTSGSNGGVWCKIHCGRFVGFRFDYHATAGMLYGNNVAFYCVWFIVALFIIDGSPSPSKNIL